MWRWMAVLLLGCLVGLVPPAQANTCSIKIDGKEIMEGASSIGSDLVGIVIVGIIFGSPVAIVAVVLFFRHRKHAQLHKTMSLWVEKGMPIPPELLARVPHRPSSDLRRSILLIATGLGLAIFFFVQKEGTWAIGLIPLLLGIGYLVVWRLDRQPPAR